MKFVAEFDAIATILSIASLVILLYAGLAIPEYAENYWVAYAFWMSGFLGAFTLGLVKRTKTFSFTRLIEIGAFGSLIMLGFLTVEYGFGQTIAQDVMFDKLGTFARGVSEELFFGIFLLGFLINLLHFPWVLAVLTSSGIHALYHVPHWGTDPMLMMMLFLSFVIARTIYVFYPKAGILLSAHGIWNFLVGG